MDLEGAHLRGRALVERWNRARLRALVLESATIVVADRWAFRRIECLQHIFWVFQGLWVDKKDLLKARKRAASAAAAAAAAAAHWRWQ